MILIWCQYFGVDEHIPTLEKKINAQFYAEAKFWTFHLTSDMDFGHAKQ